MDGMDTFVDEATNATLGPVVGKRRWWSRLIASGEGASAIYTDEALRSTGPSAFPAGTKMYADHSTWREDEEYPAGSVKRLAGIVATTPQFLSAGETTVIEGKTYTADINGLYAVTEFLENWAPFMEQIGKYVGLSIHSAYYADDDDNSVNGKPVIRGLAPSRLNSLDIVTEAGARGAVLQVMESFRDIMDSDDDKREDEGMKPEEFAEALASALKPLQEGISALQEAIKPPVDEGADKNEIDVAAVSEAVSEAALPKAARAKVYEAVKEGVAVEDAIKTQKAFIDEIMADASFKGNVMTDKTDGPVDLSVSGWSK